ncbi:hypothetical protein ACMD2_08334 [Ananas comosus]|uniref:HMA domain-containing protein n=1 Tax=Ananas comosus TaxID=4615 RepID=A0A199W3N6_ANACO|nr:hypothetical protein ACMD2_08334 [Ananas comosus]
MAAALGRVLDSAFLAIYRSFGYRSDQHRNRSGAYYYSSNYGGGNTYYYVDDTRRMGKGRPLSLQTVELKVRMCCTGCERVVKHALSKLRGNSNYSHHDINIIFQKLVLRSIYDL